MSFLIIIIYLIIALIEMVPLYKKNQKKEFLAYMVLLSTALILSLLIYFGAQLPSASRVVAKIVKFMIAK